MHWERPAGIISRLGYFLWPNIHHHHRRRLTWKIFHVFCPASFCRATHLLPFTAACGSGTRTEAFDVVPAKEQQALLMSKPVSI